MSTTASTTSPPGDDSVADRAYKKAALRLILPISVMFFVNFIDRSAISVAGPNGMNTDLGLSAAQFGFAAGIFFLGYVLLEIPSNLALARFGARKWLARILVSWGVVSLLFTWTQNIEQLYILRFLLGVAEAGFTPGVLLFLTLWFPRQYRLRAYGLFYLAQPLTFVLGPLITSLLVKHGSGLLGLDGWRFMYLAISVPAILMGVYCWLFLRDRPEEAKWLTREEKAWFRDQLDSETRERVASGVITSVRKSLTSPRILLSAIIWFGIIYGSYALTFFLPAIVANWQGQFGLKFSAVQQGLVAASVNAPAALCLLLWSRFSARRGFRKWHVALPLTIAAIAIPCASYAPTALTMTIALAVTTCGLMSTLPLFWNIPNSFLTGAGAAAGLALVNSVGNIGGFGAPYFTGLLKDATGSYTSAFWVLGAVLVLAAGATLAIKLPQSKTKTEVAATSP